MGALGHYLEESGLPTTQISLVRPHTEVMKPPRALWVPFELGRPLGAPGDSAFQRRVLLAALSLLERESGPVLEDFPEDAPAVDHPADSTGWVCPVALGAPPAGDAAPGSIAAALAKEMHLLHPWYDLGREARGGRTTVGLSQMALTALGPFITGFLDGDTPANPRDDIPLGDALKLATEDLKSFYLEAAAAQPGHRAGSADLENWFWDETTAGQVYFALRPILMAGADDSLRRMADRTLIPFTQRARKAS